MCMYPHTKYRTNKGLLFLFEKFSLYSSEYIIVVADRLNALDNLLTGKYVRKNNVFLKSRAEAEQFMKQAKKISKQSGAISSGQFYYWDELASQPEYLDFYELLKEEIFANKSMTNVIQKFINNRVERYGLGLSKADEEKYELDYILGEISMSVYCTEILRFNTEIWEKPISADMPDPLSVLYSENLDIIRKIARAEPSRKLEYLFT